MSGIIDKSGYSQTYKTLQEYTNNLKDVVNSPGYLTNNYKMICKQINVINDMVDNIKQVAITSIKHDLIDIMNKSTDWNKYKQDLTEFLKDAKHNKTPIFNRPRFYSFKFKYNDNITPLNNDLIQNMYLTLSDINENNNNDNKNKINKKIDTYDDDKDMFINELDSFIDNIPTWENNVVECRTNNIPILMSNINSLYEIHKKYAYEKIKKLPSSFEQEVNGLIIDCVKVKNKIIPLDRSQTKFIKSGIKILLEVD